MSSQSSLAAHLFAKEQCDNDGVTLLCKIHMIMSLKKHVLIMCLNIYSMYI